MKKLIAVHVAVLLLLCTGCIPSLQPFYTDKTTVFDPALLGVWVQRNAESEWAFTRKDSNTYDLTYTDKQGRAGQFDARLVQLGEQRFLDMFPDEPRVENPYYKYHLLRVHTFLKVSLNGSSLRLAGMDPQWLHRQLDADPTTVRHTIVDKTIVLTASSDELQKFTEQYADDDVAFGAVIELTPQQGATDESLKSP